MTEFSGASGSVSPATPANGPTQRVPAAVRFSVAAEDVLRRYVRGYRRIHRTRVLYWDSRPWSPYPSRSRRSPITGSTGAPRRRRDTAASLAIMAMEAEAEHVELSAVTVSPSLPAGSDTTWTTITLIALDCLVRAIRHLRGPWARQVGTMTVVMSQPGTPRPGHRPPDRPGHSARRSPGHPGTPESAGSLRKQPRPETSCWTAPKTLKSKPVPRPQATTVVLRGICALSSSFPVVTAALNHSGFRLVRRCCRYG